MALSVAAGRGLLLLAGKFSGFSRLPPPYNAAVRHHVGGALTLSSLGFDDADRKKKAIRKIKAAQITPSIKKKDDNVDDDAAPFAAKNKSFSDLGLPPFLVERLENSGYKTPTAVQSAAIPAILQNHDVVIQSHTGSGKTLAYLLPLLSAIGIENRTATTDVEAVVVAPSRELGMQIVREFEKILGPAHKRSVQQLVGGANRSRQEEALKKNKPLVVVGTPGRIAEISRDGKLRTHTSRFLVLDEVDELLGFNFREDMHRILDHVGRKSGHHRIVIMVSATVPFSVIRAAKSWGSTDPLLVQPNGVTPLVKPRADPSESESNLPPQSSIQSLPPSLNHYYTVARAQHKVDTLRRCIHAIDAKCVIVFMNRTRQLKDAVFKLEARGIKAAELHGDLGKLGRSTILKKLRNGDVRVLVTNELSARGLDVPECDLVVNLELPTDAIHYAHRAGRTGRLGRKGTVLSVCEEPEVFVVEKMEKLLGVSIQSCDFIEGKLVLQQNAKPINV